MGYVGEYMEFTKKNGYFDYKRNEQAKYWMYESINDTLRDKFYHNPGGRRHAGTNGEASLEQRDQLFRGSQNGMIDLSWYNIATKIGIKNIRVSHDLIMLHSFYLNLTSTPLSSFAFTANARPCLFTSPVMNSGIL